MTRIDIFSGFLGAGKTTLIRKLIAEGYKGEKLVLIENEFGEIAIDGGGLHRPGRKALRALPRMPQGRRGHTPGHYPCLPPE